MRLFAYISIIGLVVFLTINWFMSCFSTVQPTLFKILPAKQTGLDFSNDIMENDSFNVLNFHYIYNGGGVGIGDFNNDGLPDICFSGNQVASKVYLNQGNLKFKDISEMADFQPKGWATGVSIVDINADGWMDIFISVGGQYCDNDCYNQLFINKGIGENGVPIFEEKAKEFGLEDGLYTQQAAFFDYDLDGDLDVYLLHNVIDKRDKNVPSAKHFIHKNAIDQLLENNGNGQFVDVSEKMGILHRGYGLGIAIDDFNNDNLPDIYVANDFLSDDLLYLNNGFKNEEHQGFSEVGQAKLKHTSYNAMGVDVADVNNDGLSDIFVLDMLPAYNERQKTMRGFMNYNLFQQTLRRGYSPQFIRNTLQLHNGFLNGELLPFSEVGYMMEVYNTDWSWTPLLADFDNDGNRDLFVTNGYGKDITDLDFINYSQQRSPFGTKESQQKELYEVVSAMQPITMPNYIFKNRSTRTGRTFDNKNENWIANRNSISNGAVYSDLDNDGDLDLVVNNINEPAFLYENQTERSNSNFIKIKLKGTPQNPSGIGTKIKIWTKGKMQYHYQAPVRGYLSTVDDVVHFGLGTNEKIDSLKFIWFNGQVEILRNVTTNQTLNVMINNAKNPTVTTKTKPVLIFSESSESIKYTHQENPYLDFDVQPLLLRQYSKQGPCLVAANIDRKVGDELFIGGAKGIPAQVFYENADGSYRIQTLPNPEHEDTDAAFLDIDNDGDLDLYVVSGGVEFKENATEYEDRIYINDGQGNFKKKENTKLPKNSGSCAIVADFDKDGDIDVFVGGRVVPRKYPQIPESFLLVNENGTLTERTNQFAPKLKDIGMVTDAVWSDFDKDGWQDLILVGEAMAVTIFKNEKGKLQHYNYPTLDNTVGFWNTIAAGDFDEDGDDDYILGNLGRNARLQATNAAPIAIYTKDFDGNGSVDPLVGQFYKNKKGDKKSYPLHSRDDVMKQIVKVKNRYVKYAEFGETTFPELMQTKLSSDDYLKVNHLETSCLMNDFNMQTDRKYRLFFKPLDDLVQVAPIQNCLIEDFDKDGHLDILLSGNDYTTESNNGWYDAFNGLFLKGNGKGHFISVKTSESGFYLPFDGRDIVKMKDRQGHNKIVAGQNSKALKIFNY